MRSFTIGAAAAIAFSTHTPAAAGQSLLDRPDNISTDWIGNTGTLYFNFVHRFSVSPPPERKVTNFPTFLVATGIASQGLVGFNYATNSSLTARYPNEWEFFGRYAPLQQDDGKPFDLGGQLDYNLAVKGTDGEVSIARRDGPVRLVAVTRLIADTLNGHTSRLSYGGGGTLRFGRFIAVSGDAASLTDRQPDEKIAWSLGLHIALPNTPHTLSLHISNAGTSTLQGFARGSATRRYGFEFTIPIHVNRFFTNPEATPGMTPPSAASPGSSSTEAVAAAAAATDTAPPVAPPTAAPTTPTTPTTLTTPPTPTAPTALPPSPTGTTPTTPPGVSTPRVAAGVPPKPAPPTASTTRRVTASAAPAAHLVTARMKGQSFVPSHMDIAVGTTVQWKNLDALIHTVTAVDQSFNSGTIAADGSYSHTFTKRGTYAIYCMAHPFMKATIVVK